MTVTRTSVLPFAHTGGPEQDHTALWQDHKALVKAAWFLLKDMRLLDGAWGECNFSW